MSVDEEVERRREAATREEEARRSFARDAAALIAEIERGSQRSGWTRGVRNTLLMIPKRDSVRQEQQGRELLVCNHTAAVAGSGGAGVAQVQGEPESLRIRENPVGDGGESQSPVMEAGELRESTP